MRLKRERLLMLPEDAAHGIGDFAHSGISLHGREDRRHEIFPRSGAGFDFGNGFRGAWSIAARSERAQALDLLVLDGWVDAQNGNGLLALGAITVHAHDNALVEIHTLVVFVDGFLDFELTVDS